MKMEYEEEIIHTMTIMERNGTWINPKLTKEQMKNIVIHMMSISSQRVEVPEVLETPQYIEALLRIMYPDNILDGDLNECYECSHCGKKVRQIYVANDEWLCKDCHEKKYPESKRNKMRGKYDCVVLKSKKYKISDSPWKIIKIMKLINKAKERANL